MSTSTSYGIFTLVSNGCHDLYTRISAFNSFADKRISEIKTKVFHWIEDTFDETVARVTFVAFKVLPEIVATVGLFMGFSFVPLGILAVRSILCLTPVLTPLFKGDREELRKIMDQSVKTIKERFLKAAVATCFITATLRAVVGLATLNFGMMGTSLVFFTLGMAASSDFLPKDPEDLDLERALDAVDEPAPVSKPAPAPEVATTPTAPSSASSTTM